MTFFNSNRDVKMPKLIYGTAWKKEETASLVELAINSGFRGIDTACQPRHYNEAGVGLGIERSKIERKELYLQTKFTPFGGQDPDDCPYDPKASIEDQIITSLGVSFKNLKTDYLDGLILHSPLSTLSETLRAWQVLESFVNDKKVRQIGISNCYDPEFFKEIYLKASIKPSVLQNRFYRDTGFDKELREFCHMEKIIYESFWTLSHNRDFLETEYILSLAKKYSVTPAVILYRAVSETGIIPLCGTTSEEHMKEDLLLEEFNILPEEVDKIMEKLTNLIN